MTLAILSRAGTTFASSYAERTQKLLNLTDATMANLRNRRKGLVVLEGAAVGAKSFTIIVHCAMHFLDDQ